MAETNTGGRMLVFHCESQYIVHCGEFNIATTNNGLCEAEMLMRLFSTQFHQYL